MLHCCYNTTTLVSPSTHLWLNIILYPMSPPATTPKRWTMYKTRISLFIFQPKITFCTRSLIYQTDKPAKISHRANRTFTTPDFKFKFNRQYIIHTIIYELISFFNHFLLNLIFRFLMKSLLVTFRSIVLLNLILICKAFAKNYDAS